MGNSCVSFKGPTHILLFRLFCSFLVPCRFIYNTVACRHVVLMELLLKEHFEKENLLSFFSEELKHSEVK